MILSSWIRTFFQLNEACSFGMTDIELLIESEAFPSDTKIRHFDHTVQSNFISPGWVAFPKYPFLLRFNLISFLLIGFSYIQTMPMI